MPELLQIRRLVRSRTCWRIVCCSRKLLQYRRQGGIVSKHFYVRDKPHNQPTVTHLEFSEAEISLMVESIMTARLFSGPGSSESISMTPPSSIVSANTGDQWLIVGLEK